jgi:predicted SnoaL-like aldol condensation-catalyzing enzyme
MVEKPAGRELDLLIAERQMPMRRIRRAGKMTNAQRSNELLEKNKQVVRDFYEEVFRKRDLASADRFMYDDYIQHNPDAKQGKSGFVEFHRGFFAAVPDFCATINQLVAEGDLVYVYNTITGTHTGHGFLNHPPTGNRIKFDAVDMFRLRDGKLCEHWDVADTRALFTQVGALKAVTHAPGPARGA